MPKNLDNLNPIEALYRSRSYLQDYANFLITEGIDTPDSDLVHCILQSASQMEAIVAVFEMMRVMAGNLPPLPVFNRMDAN